MLPVPLARNGVPLVPLVPLLSLLCSALKDHFADELPQPKTYLVPDGELLEPLVFPSAKLGIEQLTEPITYLSALELRL